ncbi:response regulator transcription factor [Dyadobacter psychrophilus]|uniref:DNA-binding response regulator, OmpR family, contains REC and winged-helix (WHTH) domain n=1 Tax=Dyadobacter psychrophilus TaxID=651661 RepID=A0A1T5HG92_9BACT|nr:response regulator transcription factor [Dyadobacter psychrophilus]SKC19664.1 DNA-binding response regulator, OmpR family, contains REC and winged-helix (wHTH) domain [Dyadobacter psychrophilus]
MKVLLIEDEAGFAHDVKTYLTSNDMTCEWANTIETTLENISLFEYDCILLDLSLPDGNGMKVLTELRKQNKTEGVIIISAKDTLETRLEGLQLGADDYLTKPFHLSELLARIQSLFRRKHFEGNNMLQLNEIQIDMMAKSVKVNDQLVEMTKKEFELILYLIANKNRILSKSSLAEHLSGDMAYMLDNHDFVYTHMKNLKKKLITAGSKDYIKTVYGLGYQWIM